MHSIRLDCLILFIGIISSIPTSNAGILDWFRAKPVWYLKLEKTPLIETFHPKGLRISIGDLSGMQEFKFHANINQPFGSKYRNENGTIQFRSLEPTNGRWTYVDRDAELKENDFMHFWFYVKVNGEEYWSPKSLKVIRNIAPYPGEDMRFPRLQGPLCPCDFLQTDNDRYSMKYVQCDRDEYDSMKKELENSRLQINVLLESLLLLQKSDKNAPTLLLTGKSARPINPLDDVKNFLHYKLDTTDMDDRIKQAHYTECGTLFELDSLIDMERVLIAAKRQLTASDPRLVSEPEKAECNSFQKYNNEWIHGSPQHFNMLQANGKLVQYNHDDEQKPIEDTFQQRQSSLEQKLEVEALQ